MPKHNKLEFKNIKNTMPMPYRAYADFECATIQTDEVSSKKIKKISKQVPTAAFCIILDIESKIVARIHETGPDCEVRMLSQLKYITEDLVQQSRIEFKPTYSEQQLYKQQNKCHFCEGEFSPKWCTTCWKNKANRSTCTTCINVQPKLFKVFDHDHTTGKFRGAAHYSCNSKVKESGDRLIIPVYFHNMKSYDSHFIIKHLKTAGFSKFEGIAENKQKFKTSKCDNVQFIDSMALMKSSLDTLSKKLIWGNIECPTCKEDISSLKSIKTTETY